MRPEVGGVETIEERGAFLVVSAVYGAGATRPVADVEAADDEAGVEVRCGADDLGPPGAVRDAQLAASRTRQTSAAGRPNLNTLPILNSAVRPPRVSQRSLGRVGLPVTTIILPPFRARELDLLFTR